MLTVGELSKRLERLTFEDFDGADAPPTWRYQWGPIMFVLEQVENIDGSTMCTGTVAILGSSSQFRVSFRVTASPGERRGFSQESWEKSKTYALERMIDHAANLNPRALRETSDFLLNVGGAPVGKPALERLTAEEDTCC